MGRELARAYDSERKGVIVNDPGTSVRGELYVCG